MTFICVRIGSDLSFELVKHEHELKNADEDLAR